MRKLIAAAAGAGLVLTMAGSVFAFVPMKPMKSGIEVNNMFTSVKTLGVNVANSGPVTVMAGGVTTNKTGAAYAELGVTNTVNYTEVGGCFVCSQKSLKVNNTFTEVGTLGVNVANSAPVTVMAGGVKANTGNATAKLGVVNSVNFTVVSPMMPLQ